MIILGAIEFFYWGNRFVWFVLPDIALTALILLGTNWLLARASRAGGSVLFPSGKSTPAPREYSEQQALVVRGRFVEAADSYRAIIDDEPANIEARLRLGELLATECRDVGGAEACFVELRTLNPTPQQDWIASNALIDLYQREGRREQLKLEIARLSRQFRHTEAGVSLRRRLQELADEDVPSDGPPT